MIRQGYAPALAAGTVASAGTLGILIPPSIMLVFMGDLLSVSLGKLFIAAFLPGLALAGLYLTYVVALGLLRPGLAPPAPPLAPEERRGLLTQSLVALGVPFLLILAVLGSIIGGLATPTEAAGVGAAAALLLGLLRGRLSWPVITESTESSVLTLAMLFFIFVGATAFAYVFRLIGGEHFIVDTARALPFGDWGLLISMMAMIFVMGFFFDWIEITLIVLPIFAPIVALMDLGDHVPRAEMVYWFAILVAVNLQTSFLTPPFGFALFYLKGAAGDLVSMREIYRGIIPFVLLQIAILGLLIAWPDLALWLPRRLSE
jgi:tripartite ATP-independent transporter DctM subunit